MSTPCRVSLVLPTRDGEAFLEATVESLRAQTFRDWDLLVVDDGSRDGTPALLERLALREPRLRVLRNATPQGVPLSLNRAFAEARAPVFGWTSDDNLHHREALAVLLAALDADPSTDVVFSDYEEIDGDGRVLRRRRAGPPADLPFRNSLGPCFLYRREVHEALGGFRPAAFLVEDYDFWLRAWGRFRMARVPRVLYRYRVHPGANSSTRVRDGYLALEGVLRDLVLTSPSRTAAEKAACCWSLAWHAARARLPVESLAWLARSVLRDPRRLLLPATWAVVLPLVLGDGLADLRRRGRRSARGRQERSPQGPTR